jgi:hypothetical protein
MPITTDELDWNSEDVDLWRAFLATRTGSRLLPKLVESAPALLAEGEINAILIRNGKVLGFQESVRSLLALAVIQPGMPVAESAYPPLEQDDAWNDGQKLQQPQP